jgi:hypothetical protein
MAADDRDASERQAADAVSASLRMTDLEEALFGPGGAERAKGLLQRIDQMQVEVAAEIRAGLPPDRFEAAQAVANALAAARDLLVRIFKLSERE